MKDIRLWYKPGGFFSTLWPNAFEYGFEAEQYRETVVPPENRRDYETRRDKSNDAKNGYE